MRIGWPRKKIFLVLAPLLLLLEPGIGCGSGAGTRPVADPPAAQVPIVAHVLLLVDENHAYGSVIGNPVMPYTNQRAQQYALATQYYANVHQSLPNYFMLTVGNLITSTDLYTGTVTADNVARAVNAAGKTWRVYAESLPNTGYLGASAIPYDRNHNPFTYFSDIQTSAAQAANVVPFTQLATDLAGNTLPDYSMIIPNLADNGHDCPSEAPSCTDTQKLANVDSWMQANVGPLIQSPEFQSSVLISTWDESILSDVANGGGHVATILVGPSVKHGYQSITFYQHQSTLRLTMELLGISDYPGAAATAPEMAEFF